MPNDPLETVLSLRRRAVDEARATLARRSDEAGRAHTDAAALEHAIEHEAQRASDLDGDDARVEAFALWLPGARTRARQARDRHERLEAEVARARADLAARRTALESIEQLMANRAAEARAEAAREEQRDLDERAARARPPDIS